MATQVSPIVTISTDLVNPLSMELVLDTLYADWEAFLRFAPRLFYGSALLVLFLVAGKLVGRGAAKILKKSRRFGVNEGFLRHLISWTIGSIGVLLALGLMGFHGIAASLLATGGVAAIVLGFAFREIGENFLAGFFLMFSRPFELGDLIKTGELTGIVRAIELRYVHIRTFDACDVFVPSAQIFREPLYNYTRDGLRRPSFTVGVAYEDEPAKVIDVLESACRSVTDVLKNPHPFAIIKGFDGSYIVYEVFFWIDVNKTERGYLATKSDVKGRCRNALRDAGVTFPAATPGLDIQHIPMLEVKFSPKEGDER